MLHNSPTALSTRSLVETVQKRRDQQVGRLTTTTGEAWFPYRLDIQLGIQERGLVRSVPMDETILHIDYISFYTDQTVSFRHPDWLLWRVDQRRARETFHK